MAPAAAVVHCPKVVPIVPLVSEVIMFQWGVWIVECKGVDGVEEKGEECAVESEKVGEWDR